MTSVLILTAGLIAAQPKDDATATLLRTGTDAQKVAALVQVRQMASDKFVRRNAKAPDPLPYLNDVVALLRDESRNTRFFACETLLDFRVHAAVAVPDLRKILRDDTIPMRRRAAVVLDLIGPPAKDAVPELLKCLELVDPNDDDPKATVSGVVTCSAFALGAIGPDAKEAVPAMLKFLESDNSHRRHVALVALGGIRSEPDKVLPAILKISTDPKQPWQRRRVANNALGDFGVINDEVIASISAPILNPLDEKEDPVRAFDREAMSALGRLGPKALTDKVLDKLIDTLGQSAATEATVVGTLAKMGPRAKKALPALKEQERLRKFNLSYAEAIKAIDK